MKRPVKTLLQNKQLTFFTLKAFIYACIFLLPLQLYDTIYGTFYRNINGVFLNEFKETGIASFKKGTISSVTRVEIANTKMILPNSFFNIATSEFNTRYRGYIPTIFFIILMLATPMKTKRKATLLLIGVSIITVAVVYKQWIHIQYMCKEAKWLQLFQFSESDEKRITFLYNNFANYNGPTLILAVAIWLFMLGDNLFEFRVKKKISL